MSQPRRRKAQGRQAPNRARKPATGRDFWGRDDDDEEAPALIRPSEDPTAMIRSLGPPPLPLRAHPTPLAAARVPSMDCHPRP